MSSSPAELAFGGPIDWEVTGTMGVIRFGPEKSNLFPPLPLGQARTLLEHGYIDPSHRFRGAPAAGDLIDWAEELHNEYKSWQPEIGLVGQLRAPDLGSPRVTLYGVSVVCPGRIPDSLQRDTAKRFSGDVLSVGDCELVVTWE